MSEGPWISLSAQYSCLGWTLAYFCAMWTYVKKTVNCRQFTNNDENLLAQDSHQQMHSTYKQMNCKDWSNKKHQNPDNGRVYINPREHYV